MHYSCRCSPRLQKEGSLPDGGDRASFRRRGAILANLSKTSLSLGHSALRRRRAMFAQDSRKSGDPALDPAMWEHVDPVAVGDTRKTGIRRPEDSLSPCAAALSRAVAT